MRRKGWSLRHLDPLPGVIQFQHDGDIGRVVRRGLDVAQRKGLVLRVE